MGIVDLIRLGYSGLGKGKTLPKHVLYAAERILLCRTAALGGHVQVCPNGHYQRVWYNSCRHRFCPQCAFISMERWLDRQKARLLGCEHFHAVFTIPDTLHPLWLANVREMTGLLFRAVHDTLFELLEDPKYLGATVGVMATLHTWGQTLVLHPHIHCLVTGGGLTAAGEWRAVRNGYLLPFRVVRAVFAGKMIAAIRKGVRQGRLEKPPGLQCERLLKDLGRKKWHVMIMERYAHGAGVATYLARYMRGGPIRDSRIVASDEGGVLLRYTDNRATKEAGGKVRDVMKLSVEEFLRRLLLHVPEPGTKVVRHWGLYCPTKDDELNRSRELLGQAPVEGVEDLDWQSCCERLGATHPELCPVCGTRLLVGDALPPERVERPLKLPHQEAA